MKNNIKFLIKFAITVCLALCLLSVVNFLYTNGETYNGTYAGIEKFDNVPTDIQFANFGPSYGMNCFGEYADWEEKGRTCFNFSLTMQDFHHDYHMYKKYKNNFAEGAIVAVPVSYFSFCSNADENSSSRYYKILDKSAIRGYSFESYISANYMPVYGKGSSFVRDLVNDTLNSILMKSSGTSSDETADENSAEQNIDTEKSHKKLSDDSKARVLTVESGNLKPYASYIEENEEILIKWIEEMKSDGITPVLMLTPYYHEYANGFDKELLDKGFNEPMKRVLDKTDVRYINFNSEEYNEYINTPEYFINCDHISKKGSSALFVLYEEYLKKVGLIK